MTSVKFTGTVKPEFKNNLGKYIVTYEGKERHIDVNKFMFAAKSVQEAIDKVDFTQLQNFTIESMDHAAL